MKVRHVLQHLFNQAPIVHSFLLVFLFLSFFLITIKPDDGKIHSVSIFPFIYAMIFVGMAIGKALENTRQTYLWSTNLDYQMIHKTILYFLPIALCSIFMIIVVLTKSGNELFVLLGLLVLYTMIFTHDLEKASYRMILMYMPLLLLLQNNEKATWLLNDNYGLFIVFCYYGIILFDSIIGAKINKGYIKEGNVNQPKGKLFIHRFKFLQPNYKKKDVGLSLSINGNMFPIYGVLMALVVVIFAVIMKFLQTKELNNAYPLLAIYFLNLLLILRSRHLIKQVKNFAHVFAGKNHLGVKNKLLIAMDKKILLNNISFISILLICVYMFDLPFNESKLTMYLFMTLIFIFNTYLLVIAIKNSTRIELGITFFILYSTAILILFALIDEYESMFHSWSFNLGILFIAMLTRYYSHRKFNKVLFEELYI